MSVERRREEIKRLQSRYSAVEHGENLDWILFKEFPLPTGWNWQATPLLVIVPAGYPTTPPDNFYVRTGLRLGDGRVPGNYTENQSILGQSWGQFSFHAQAWNHAGDIDSGDSLLTFMISVERRLEERS
jgi:Prokaryotic E2 family E